jgi:DegV family protein with EDD domain
MPATGPSVKDWLDKLAQRALSARARLRAADKEAVRRPQVAVVTDSAAALPAGWAEQAGVADLVRIVPMPVMVAEQIFGEGMDDLGSLLAIALAEGKPVRTSRPSPGLFEAAYRELAAAGFTAVVSIHLSAELSGTVDAARLAAAKVDIPVTVLDSRTGAMAQGFGVVAAALASLGGADAAATAAKAEAVMRTSALYFFVPTLEQLRRGGRIGTAASIVGTLLSVKPLLAVRAGAIVPLEKVRSSAKAIARLEELTDLDIAARTGTVRLAVHCFGNPGQADTLAASLIARHPDAEIVISPLPAVLAAHTGLGVLAVAIVDAIVDGGPA